MQAICIRTTALHVHSKSVDRSIAPFLKGRGLLKVSLPLHLSGLVSRPSGPNVTPEGMLPDCAIACVPRYMGSRTQHRVIDNTRFLIQPRYTQPEYAKKKNTNLTRTTNTKTRIRITRQKQRPQQINIHRPNTIIIRRITTTITNIQMPIMITIQYVK